MNLNIILLFIGISLIIACLPSCEQHHAGTYIPEGNGSFMEEEYE